MREGTAPAQGGGIHPDRKSVKECIALAAPSPARRYTEAKAALGRAYPPEADTGTIGPFCRQMVRLRRRPRI
jgi:hypothetical protein